VWDEARLKKLTRNKRNVILLIADDLGVDVLTEYGKGGAGATYPSTPNITSLMRGGITFTRAYANPVCSPTRATLITGRYGFRTGIGRVVQGGEAGLAEAEHTLADQATTTFGSDAAHANLGKWHLGAQACDQPRTHGGWQHFAGVLSGAIDDYGSWNKVEDGSEVCAVGAPATCNPAELLCKQEVYATQDNVDDAIHWLDNVARVASDPWLLWIGFNAPHDPLHRPPREMVSTARNDELDGLGLPVGGECCVTATTSGVGGQCADPALARTCYLAMVEALDYQIGRLLAATTSATGDPLVDFSKTTVIFIGDNGTPGSVINSSERGSKGQLAEGGVHVPLVIRGGVQNVGDTGRWSEALVNSVDLYATILDLMAADQPADPDRPLDAQSLRPILNGTATSVRDFALVETFGGSSPGKALRGERYKLWLKDSDCDQQLHDLQLDPTEGTDLLDGSTPAACADADALSGYCELWQVRESLRASLAAEDSSAGWAACETMAAKCDCTKM
jgi:arylsulfatase A-like enzyme